MTAGGSTDRPLVLIIDETPPVVRLISLELGFQGFATVEAIIDDDPVAKAEAFKPDAILLGALLPTPDVYELLGRLRQLTSAPLLFLHASGNDSDAALALEFGATEVVSRPFTPEELGLRLRNLLGEEIPEGRLIRRGSMTLDPLRRLIWKGEQKLALGTNEWSLLLALSSAEQPMTADELLTKVWGSDYAREHHFLTLWIDRLRTNVGDDRRNPTIVLGDIESGYKLSDSVE